MSSSDKKSLLSVKMEHSIMRNQMKRIIENLLYFSYLFNEYQKLLKEEKEGFASRIFLKNEDKALRNR